MTGDHHFNILTRPWLLHLNLLRSLSTNDSRSSSSLQQTDKAAIVKLISAKDFVHKFAVLWKFTIHHPRHYCDILGSTLQKINLWQWTVTTVNYTSWFSRINLPLGVYMPCCMEPPGSNTGALKSATAESISSKLQLPGTMPLFGLGFSGIWKNILKENVVTDDWI